MADQTKIEWCDSTFNPWVGCTKVSPGCDNCYAERDMSSRLKVVKWGAGNERQRTRPANWKRVEKWNREHEAFFAEHGRRRRVFCASLADVFDNEVPVVWRVDLVELIVATPNLDWLILTKRIGNVCRMWPAEPIPNVWLGISVVNQEEADRDIPKLLDAPARVRWLSAEPLLGSIDLERVQWPGKHKVDVLRRGAWDVPGWRFGFTNHSDMSGIDWVVVGGESGPKARPMHPQWARDLRDQCASAGVPFLFKQWGEWICADQGECPVGPPVGRWMWGDGTPFEYGDGQRGPMPLLCRSGKKAAGRHLDGVLHDGYPS